MQKRMSIRDESTRDAEIDINIQERGDNNDPALKGLINNFASKIFGRKSSILLSNVDAAYGMRFLTQIALLPRAVSAKNKATAATIVGQIRGLLTSTESRGYFDVYLSLMDRIFRSSGRGEQDLRTPFTEFMPLDMIKEAVSSKLRDVHRFSDILPAAQQLTADLEKPIQVDPNDYLQKLSQSIAEYHVFKKKSLRVSHPITPEEYDNHPGLDVLSTLDLGHAHDTHKLRDIKEHKTWKRPRILSDGYGHFSLHQPGMGHALMTGETIQIVTATPRLGGILRIHSGGPDGPIIADINVHYTQSSQRAWVTNVPIDKQIMAKIRPGDTCYFDILPNPGRTPDTVFWDNPIYFILAVRIVRRTGPELPAPRH